MQRNRKPTPTRAVIVKTASELFFDRGFSKTTATALCREIGISSGNLTFYFPTKEHILAVIVKMMCEYQWKELEEVADEGSSSLLAYCLELPVLISVGDELPQMQDFLRAAYAHPMTLDLIRVYDVEKIRKVFSSYTEGWSEEKFMEVETIVSGIEYASIVHTAHSVSVEHRIEGALHAILGLFGVPEEIQREKVSQVLSMDYRALGRRVYEDFKQYVTETNELALEQIMKDAKIKRSTPRKRR